MSICARTICAVLVSVIGWILFIVGIIVYNLSSSTAETSLLASLTLDTSSYWNSDPRRVLDNWVAGGEAPFDSWAEVTYDESVRPNTTTGNSNSSSTTFQPSCYGSATKIGNVRSKKFYVSGSPVGLRSDTFTPVIASGSLARYPLGKRDVEVQIKNTGDKGVYPGLQNSFKFTLNDVPLTTQKSFPIKCVSSDSNNWPAAGSEKGCSSANLETFCRQASGFSSAEFIRSRWTLNLPSTPFGSDLQVGECTYRAYADDICVVIAYKSGIERVQRSTEYNSCYYPFTDASAVNYTLTVPQLAPSGCVASPNNNSAGPPSVEDAFTAINTDVSVTVRVEGDPFLEIQKETEGSMDLSPLAFTALVTKNSGVALVAMGIMFVVGSCVAILAVRCRQGRGSGGSTSYNRYNQEVAGARRSSSSHSRHRLEDMEEDLLGQGASGREQSLALEEMFLPQQEQQRGQGVQQQASGSYPAPRQQGLQPNPLQTSSRNGVTLPPRRGKSISPGHHLPPPPAYSAS